MQRPLKKSSGFLLQKSNFVLELTLCAVTGIVPRSTCSLAGDFWGTGAKKFNGGVAMHLPAHLGWLGPVTGVTPPTSVLVTLQGP